MRGQRLSQRNRDIRSSAKAFYHPLHPMNDRQAEGHMARHIVRRKFLATLGGAAAAWPLAVSAQQAGKIHKVGYLSPSLPSVYSPLLFDNLRELGWIEGKNVTFEYR